MTVSLLVLVPVALLVLIGGFCFVGCTFNTHGLGLGFTTYSDSDVIGNPNCVAYWPLNDSPGQNAALDVVGKALGNPHNGVYKNVANVSGPDTQLFPIPGFDVSATVHSAAAPGTQTIGAPGIVTGDTQPPHDANNPVSATCMQVNGGFVTVDSNKTCNPDVFTVECWVQPEWGANDQPATRQFIDSRGIIGANIFGYGLRVDQNGNWAAEIGSSGGNFVQFVADKAQLNVPTHVVLTFDGTNAAIFTGGVQTGLQTGIAGFVPNTASPLVIGVAGSFATPRTTGAVEPPALFPFLPFNGKIQDVAIYNEVLNDETIQIHATNGMGQAAG